MFRWFNKQLKNEKGFTLVELMVVVVIIGILVAIAIPVYSNITASSEKSACHATQRTIDGAIQMAAADDDPTSDWTNYVDGAPECPTNDVAFTTTNYAATGAGCPDDAQTSHGSYR